MILLLRLFNFFTPLVLILQGEQIDSVTYYEFKPFLFFSFCQQLNIRRSQAYPTLFFILFLYSFLTSLTLLSFAHSLSSFPFSFLHYCLQFTLTISLYFRTSSPPPVYTFFYPPPQRQGSRKICLIYSPYSRSPLG